MKGENYDVHNITHPRRQYVNQDIACRPRRRCYCDSNPQNTWQIAQS